MSDAFAPIVRARPDPIFGRPVHQGSPPFDYSPILLLKPFGFRITPDTLSSSEQTRWPTRHYPRLWIQRPSSERRRDFNPPDSCAAQRTLRAAPPLRSASVLSPSRLEPLAASPFAPSARRSTGSHVPYDSLVELRAAYMPDVARAVSGIPRADPGGRCYGAATRILRPSSL